MREATIRAVALALGFVFLLLGIVGVIMPVMPGTIFLILAAFAFSRGSKRLYHWLMEHPVLGPPIRDYVRHGVIRRNEKRVILISIAATLVIVATLGVLFGVPLWVVVLEALVLALVMAFVAARPEEVPREQGHLAPADETPADGAVTRPGREAP